VRVVFYRQDHQVEGPGRCSAGIKVKSVDELVDKLKTKPR